MRRKEEVPSASATAKTLPRQILWASIDDSSSVHLFRLRSRRRLSALLVDIAYPRTIGEEGGAFIVSRFALALDVGNDIIRDGLDFRGPQEHIGLGRHLVCRVLARHVVAFCLIVRAADKK